MILIKNYYNFYKRPFIGGFRLPCCVFSTKTTIVCDGKDKRLIDTWVSPEGYAQFKHMGEERRQMVNALHHNGCYFFYIKIDASRFCSNSYFWTTGFPCPTKFQFLNTDGKLAINYGSVMVDFLNRLGGYISNPEFAYIGLTKVDFPFEQCPHDIAFPRYLYINVIFSVRSLLGNSELSVGEFIAENLRTRCRDNNTPAEVTLLPTRDIVHQRWDALLDTLKINDYFDEASWHKYHSWQFYHWNYHDDKRVGLVRTRRPIRVWGKYFDSIYEMSWSWDPPVSEPWDCKIPTVFSNSIYEGPTILLHLLRVYCLVFYVEYFNDCFYQKKITFYTPLGNHLWFRQNIKPILDALCQTLPDQLFILDIPRIINAQLDNTIRLIELDPSFLTKGW